MLKCVNLKKLFIKAAATEYFYILKFVKFIVLKNMNQNLRPEIFIV